MACHRATEFDLEVLFREPDSPECRDFVAHTGDCSDCAAALQRHLEAPTEAPPRTPSVAVAGAAAVIVAVIALLALSERSGDVPESTSAVAEDRAPIADAATGVESGTAAAIEPLAALHLDLGEEREIEAAALPAGEPILLSLAVPIVTDGVGTLPVRLIAEDGRVLESPGSVRDDDRERAEVAIEPDWLNRPGRYIVEVRTTEKTHLPLRRYAIRVR